MVKIDSRELRERVTIQARDESTLSTYGEVTEAWTTYIARWAKVEPLSGREYSRQDGSQAEITHRVTMRSDSETRAITPKHRVSYDSRVLQIVRATDVGERNIKFVLDCKEEA